MGTEVRKIGPLGPYDNNAYVIVDTGTKQSLFIDAPSESERALDEAKDTKVQRIVVTHRHGDHWANIDLVKEKLGAPVMCHEADRAPYERKVDATVGDGDDLSVGDTRVRVLHTPGHTPGSVCLLVESAEPPVLISGSRVAGDDRVDQDTAAVAGRQDAGLSGARREYDHRGRAAGGRGVRCEGASCGSAR